MARMPLVWTGALLAVVSACGGTASDETTVRDSAGVRLVEHGRNLPRALDAWTLDPVPTLDVGRAAGEDPYLFARIGAASLLPAGELLVAETRAVELRVFDSTGRFVRRLGRKGSGPGEFQAMSWVGVDPAGVASVFDASTRRLTRLAATGEVERVTSLPGAGGGTVAGVFRDGSLLMRRFPNLSEDLSQVPTGLVRDSLELMVVAADGSGETPIARVPGPENVRAVGRVVSQDQAPFGRRTVIAAGDSTFFVATQDSYEIRSYHQTGGLRSILRRRVPPRRVDDAARARWRQQHAERLERLKGRPVPPEVTQVAEYDRLPEAFPALGELALDRSGRLWVEDYRPFPAEDSVTTWTVFGPTGALEARATLPNLQILEIGAEHLVGVWRDQDEVPHVRVYRIVRRPQ